MAQEHEKNESEGGRRKHHFAQHRKHGGHVKHHGKHHKADGGGLSHEKPEKADGNPYVVKEAESGKSIGKIGGVKSKHRLDRKHGGACHKHGGHAHHDGMPKVHHGHGGVAKHHTHAGGHHGAHGHASGGGADTEPYSSAGKGLRHKRGGACH
jgi:hypothetical protein